MSARRSLVIVPSGLAALLAVAACESVIGADFGDVQEVDCKHAAPPARPAVDGGGDRAVLVAITSLDVGETDHPDGRPKYREIGFDLDGVCSNLGQRPACRGFAWARPDPTDGIDGIDNSAGAMMHGQLDAFNLDPFKSAGVSDEIREGSVAPVALLRIRNYNLRVQDDAVELDWYVAEPLHRRPALDGTDAWPIWDGTLEPGAPASGGEEATGGSLPPSRFRDVHAYVEDYTLVAHLPAGTPIKMQSVAFVSEGLTVTLKLAYDPLRVSSGVVGGLVRATELFRKMPQMTDAFGLGKFCQKDPSYPTVKEYFCRFIDARADGRPAPDAPCDALSLGMRFETTIVRPGPQKPAGDVPTCPPELDPATDSCETPGGNQ